MEFKTNQGIIRMPLPKKDMNEMFAIVNRVLGGSRMDVHCEDGKSRLARIPGGRRRRMGRIRTGDLVIVNPWDIQDSKADVIYRYRRNQVRLLSNKNILPQQVDVYS
jgi:translation initiation factor 1A